MARYSKSLKKFFTSEVQHMQELAAHLNDARTWLCKDEAQLTAIEKRKLEELTQQNAQLRKMIEMRRDLQASVEPLQCDWRATLKPTAYLVSAGGGERCIEPA
jgi:small-conductance mechanosensitive channel